MAIDGIMLEAGLADAAPVRSALLLWLMGRVVMELRIFGLGTGEASGAGCLSVMMC